LIQRKRGAKRLRYHGFGDISSATKTKERCMNG